MYNLYPKYLRDFSIMLLRDILSAINMKMN